MKKVSNPIFQKSSTVGYGECVNLNNKNNLYFIVIRSLILDLVLVKINGLAKGPRGRRDVRVGGEAAAVDQAAAAAQVVAVRVSFKVVAVPTATAIHKLSAFFGLLIIVPPQVVGSAGTRLLFQAADVSGVLSVESAFGSRSLAQDLFPRTNEL